MIKIFNEPSIDQPDVNGIRNAIEHRATWFYLILDEVRKNGLNMEKIGRAAINNCGCFHGSEKMLKNCRDINDMKEFFKVFADETVQKVFEMEILESTENILSLDFHYCPLVAAWKKLGVPEEDISILCDIAMDGDRGIVSQFEGYIFNLESSIASGGTVCKIRIDKEK